VGNLHKQFGFLTERWAKRLVRAYGSEAWDLLAGAETADDLGQDFGATLTEREVAWLMDHEYARTAEDVIWRRSKLGLRLNETQKAALQDFMQIRMAKA
ncbi:MAG: glycerol-3-phosphate dehydrogenase C-terminal domain-containing protein, partial [Pseudomonadota bacterium]|nr:glycerol-3-phosphate dehydrogenase C-terminal domain-containing protein [Pseudomonadota bacterium]